MAAFFTDARYAAWEIAAHQTYIDRSAFGYYITLNPVSPAAAARARAAAKSFGYSWKLGEFARAGRNSQAGDDDTCVWQYIVLDIDAERDGPIAATDAEVAQARAVADDCKEYLCHQMGWPDPMYIFSGNGFYLIFRVSLQNNAEDRLLVKHFLYGMDYQFSNVSGAAKVDTSVGNPSRIIRIPGTFNRKGNPSQHRPHRQCRIISLPSPMVAVSREQMEAVVNEVNCPRCFAVQSTGLDPQAIADLKLGGSSDAISRCVAYVGKVIATATGQHKQVESLRMARCCYEFGLSTEEATVIMPLAQRPPFSRRPARRGQDRTQAIRRAEVDRGEWTHRL